MEEQLRGMREDMAELVAEQTRTRQRLHKVEGATDLLLGEQRENREATKRRQDAILRRQNWLLVLVAVLGLFVPIIANILTAH